VGGAAAGVPRHGGPVRDGHTGRCGGLVGVLRRVGRARRGGGCGRGGCGPRRSPHRAALRSGGATRSRPGCPGTQQRRRPVGRRRRQHGRRVIRRCIYCRNGSSPVDRSSRGLVARGFSSAAVLLCLLSTPRSGPKEGSDGPGYAIPGHRLTTRIARLTSWDECVAGGSGGHPAPHRARGPSAPGRCDAAVAGGGGGRPAAGTSARPSRARPRSGAGSGRG
jgi:hypothetical protein